MVEGSSEALENLFRKHVLGAREVATSLPESSYTTNIAFLMNQLMTHKGWHLDYCAQACEATCLLRESRHPSTTIVSGEAKPAICRAISLSLLKSFGVPKTVLSEWGG
jgi:hypothetical protein